ncbi:MAG: lysophospholipid acyltransferase family protein [Limnobacter sp.]|nr:lysophospholipid acyltransferase family protein [Limnobacter sp.]
MIKRIFHLLAYFPLWLLHLFGCVAGLLVYLVSSSYRAKMIDHIEVLYPEDTPRRRSILRQSAMHSGMALFELPYLWGRSRQKGIHRIARIEDWGLAQSVLDEGKGVLFLTPHLGSFEGTAQIFSTTAPITVLYRPNRNPEVQQIIEASRSRDSIKLAPTNMSGVRKLLRGLKQNEAVGLLPDQVPSSGEGVWVPMFGRQAYTMTLPGALVKATGCKVLLAVGYRRAFFGITLKFFPGPSSLSSNPAQSALEINQAMEEIIKQFPEQYYWGYERYKAPKGKPVAKQSDQPT